MASKICQKRLEILFLVQWLWSGPLKKNSIGKKAHHVGASMESGVYEARYEVCMYCLQMRHGLLYVALIDGPNAGLGLVISYITVARAIKVEVV